MLTTLKSVFVWFYCLPAETAAKYMLAAGLLLIILKERFESRSWWRPLLTVVLILWGALVSYATVFSREGGVTGAPNLIPFHSYREVNSGGSWEILLSNYMNILLFFPAGMLMTAALPGKRHWLCRLLLAVIFFFTFSACLEYAQYRFGLGRTEIDDVIHNALGALLGGIFGIIRLPPLPKERG